MKKQLLATTAAIAITAGPALSQSIQDQIVAALQAQDYDYIEITNSPNQIKVEAIRGGFELEAIYDSAGNLLFEEVSEADDEDLNERGVSYETEDEDFLDDDDDEDEDDDDEDDDEDDEDDDEDDEDEDEDEDDEDDDDEDDEDDDDDEDDEDEDDDE